MKKLYKYILVGGSAAVVNWCIFFVCTKIFLLHYIISGIISFLIATLWNFLLARKFVFDNSTHSPIKEISLIYAVSLIGLCIDIVILSLCVEFFLLDSMLGKIIATGIAFGFNFGMRNFVIYR